ncbi:MAG: endonuclease MutS2, partial [Leptotrichiaceae bacterium]
MRIRNFKKEKGLGMEKNYDVLEFYKIINNLIDLARLEITKDKFIDTNIIKSKSELDKEMILMQEFIDYYKYDDGLDIVNISNIQRHINSIGLIGSYLSSEELVDLKKNLVTYRISRSRTKNVRDKYKASWLLFSDVDDLKDIEKYIEDVANDDGTLKDDASIGLREIRRQKYNLNGNIKEKFDDIMSNKDLSKAVQERLITTRNERFVIPIKTEFKALIKGIEHDRSATGSTVYIEPLNVVSLNNKLREYEAREREEIRKILLRVTELVKTKKEEIIQIKEIIERLDYLNAKTLYSLENDCIVPKIINKEYLKLVEARHPLISKDEVVPINFELGSNEKIMLITGPNTGGKTVTLKVAGLLTLMALSGIPIPVNEKTEIGFFDNVLADIGDEQSIEQNLSSFSGHVKSIKEIVEKANSRSLVLMDELGSGTDPMEGSAFAMAIIDYLKEKHIMSIITTHY